MGLTSSLVKTILIFLPPAGYIRCTEWYLPEVLPLQPHPTPFIFTPPNPNRRSLGYKLLSAAADGFSFAFVILVPHQSSAHGNHLGSVCWVGSELETSGMAWNCVGIMSLEPWAPSWIWPVKTIAGCLF